jgi:DNA-binding beta-propeller fold protein YncE
VTNKITQTIKLTGRPVGVNFSPDGKRVYVSDFGPDSLKEQATAGLTFLASGQLTTKGPGTLSVFEVATGKQVGDSVTTGAGPTSIVVSDSAH